MQHHLPIFIIIVKKASDVAFNNELILGNVHTMLKKFENSVLLLFVFNCEA